MRTYKIGGLEYPSVTTVLSIWYDKIYPQTDDSFKSYMQQRADIGTHAHKMIELSLKGHAITDEQKAMYNGESWQFYQQVWPIIKAKPLIYSEVKIHSNQLRVAGTCDMVFKSHVDGMAVIYDLKTTKKPKYGVYLDGYKMQLSAYAHCFNCTYGVPVEKAVIMMAYPTGSQEIELERNDIREYLNKFADIRKQFNEKHGI